MKKIRYIFTADMMDLIQTVTTLEEYVYYEMERRYDSFLVALGYKEDSDEFFLLTHRVTFVDLENAVEIHTSTLEIDHVDESMQLIHYSVEISVDVDKLLAIAKKA